jgi:uncharacterized protein YwqG
LANTVELNNSQLISHIGGVPYFEEGEAWPVDDHSTEIEFIMQIFDSENTPLPFGLKLIQVFIHSEENMPWDDEYSKGWKIKGYKYLNIDNRTVIKSRLDNSEEAYKQLSAENCKSLPDWDSVDRYDESISKLCIELESLIQNTNSYDYYNEAVIELIGDNNTDYRTQLLGYSNCIQGEVNFNSKDKLELLLQIDSTDLNTYFADAGLMYIAYDEVNDKFKFEIQST